MTCHALRREVLGMGFGDVLEDETVFYASLNRALLQVAQAAPQRKSVTLDHDPPALLGFTAYDITALCPRFRELDAYPLRVDGFPLTEGRDYRREGGVLHISNRFRGTVSVHCLCLPHTASMDDPDAEIDLAEEALPALVLLCAAYTWLESSPDRASWFYARYLETVRSLSLPAPDLPVIDTSRWSL